MPFLPPNQQRQSTDGLTIRKNIQLQQELHQAYSATIPAQSTLWTIYHRGKDPGEIKSTIIMYSKEQA